MHPICRPLWTDNGAKLYVRHPRRSISPAEMYLPPGAERCRPNLSYSIFQSAMGTGKSSRGRYSSFDKIKIPDKLPGSTRTISDIHFVNVPHIFIAWHAFSPESSWLLQSKCSGSTYISLWARMNVHENLLILTIPANLPSDLRRFFYLFRTSQHPMNPSAAYSGRNQSSFRWLNAFPGFMW